VDVALSVRGAEDLSREWSSCGTGMEGSDWPTICSLVCNVTKWRALLQCLLARVNILKTRNWIQHFDMSWKIIAWRRNGFLESSQCCGNFLFVWLCVTCFWAWNDCNSFIKSSAWLLETLSNASDGQGSCQLQIILGSGRWSCHSWGTWGNLEGALRETWRTLWKVLKGSTESTKKTPSKQYGTLDQGRWCVIATFCEKPGVA